MRIHLLVAVDDDVAEHECASRLTPQAHEQLTDASTSTMGEVLDVSARVGDDRTTGGCLG